MPSIAVLDDHLSELEVRAAVDKISTNSSSGSFSVPTGFFKRLMSFPYFLQLLTQLLNFVYHSGHIPESWTSGFLTPVPKPGKTFCAENCRPIAVTPLPFRVLSSILTKRFEMFINLNGDQFAFRSGKEASDAGFRLHTVCEKMIAQKEAVYLAFIDLSSAFDSIN